MTHDPNQGYQQGAPAYGQQHGAQYPPPPHPHNYPAPPGYGYPPPTQQPGNGLAIAGMVCGIVGLLILNIILRPLALIFGGIGLSGRTAGPRGGDSRSRRLSSASST